MTTTKTTLSAAFALALALGLGACSTDDDPQTPDQTAGQEASDDGADPGSGSGATEETTDAGSGSGDDDAATQGDLTAQALQAIATAEEEAGGTAYEIDDQDDDRTWEVDVAVGDRSVEVTLDADGVTVVGTEDDDLDGDDRAALDAATITLPDAIKLAIDEVGGVLDDAELDEDDGTYYWEVTVDGTEQGDDVEVKVSVTGEIIEID